MLPTAFDGRERLTQREEATAARQTSRFLPCLAEIRGQLHSSTIPREGPGGITGFLRLPSNRYAGDIQNIRYGESSVFIQIWPSRVLEPVVSSDVADKALRWLSRTRWTALKYP